MTVAEHADGTGFTELTYLTSERETRAADRQMPVEMAVQLGTVRSYVEALEEVELCTAAAGQPGRAGRLRARSSASRVARAAAWALAMTSLRGRPVAAARRAQSEYSGATLTTRPPSGPA